MSALVDAAANGVVVEVQRLLKEGASVNEVDQWGRPAMKAVVDNWDITHVVRTLMIKCLIKEGSADIDAVLFVHMGRNYSLVTLFAMMACYPMVLWLLEEGAAIPINIWHNVAKARHYEGEDAGELSSLLKVLTLLPMSPYQDLGLPPFVATLSPQHVDLFVRGRQLRAWLSLYVKQQQTSLRMHCALPVVLQTIVIAVALPTPIPEELWSGRFVAVDGFGFENLGDPLGTAQSLNQ
jgi:hypothetical protein